MYLLDAEFCGVCGTTLGQSVEPRTVHDVTSEMSALDDDDESVLAQLKDDDSSIVDRPELYGFFLNPRRTDQRIVINEGDHTIGAGGKNDIIIDRPAVSWNHALLVARNSRLLLQDSASTNGTYVNRVRVSRPRELRHADLIRFGNVEFRVWLKPQLRNWS